MTKLNLQNLSAQKFTYYLKIWIERAKLLKGRQPTETQARCQLPNCPIVNCLRCSKPLKGPHPVKRRPVVNCPIAQLSTVLIPSRSLPSAKLDIVVVLLLFLTLGGLVIGFAARARAQDDGQNDQETKILFHGVAHSRFIRLDQ